ncbi:hypothetical protein EYD46_06100 [Hyunsoonleella pacifica]|uniref:Cathelicidin antimicrobial peptide C-terminal domain-containing protein n=1 Tax=Hyunsoonleella pacifica TaxID=1080224 RepID=A0A4V2JBA3_9FLAO|nr:hypothetical protein EYD46_06100 [Hyunsoonleella pacifica]
MCEHTRTSGGEKITEKLEKIGSIKSNLE